MPEQSQSTRRRTDKRNYVRGAFWVGYVLLIIAAVVIAITVAR